MTVDKNIGLLHEFYRNRVGEPTTHDEVRGYWVFLTGLLLGTIGILVFIPGAAPRATSFTLREASIFIAAVGLVMMVAGPVIRLPLQSWANYAAYAGQAIGFVAAVWFVIVFPNDWVVTTGNQPVIVLYALGLAVITLGGAIVPLLAESDDEVAARAAADAEAEAMKSEVSELRTERDQMADELEAAETAAEDAETEAAELSTRLDALYTSQGRFELYEDRGGAWRWWLRHRNGNLVASSGEGYTRKHNAQKGMASVRRDALGATTLLFESEPELPDEEASFEPVAEAGSGATIEAYEDNAGTWRWRLVHRNSNILADSGSGYSRRNDANRAVERIQTGLDDFEFETYEDQGGEYRWRLKGSNDRIVADSGEGYTDRGSVEDAVERVRTPLSRGRCVGYRAGGLRDLRGQRRGTPVATPPPQRQQYDGQRRGLRRPKRGPRRYRERQADGSSRRDRRIAPDSPGAECQSVGVDR